RFPSTGLALSTEISRSKRALPSSPHRRARGERRTTERRLRPNAYSLHLIRICGRQLNRLLAHSGRGDVTRVRRLVERITKQQVHEAVGRGSGFAQDGPVFVEVIVGVENARGAGLQRLPIADEQFVADVAADGQAV